MKRRLVGRRGLKKRKHKTNNETEYKKGPELVMGGLILPQKQKVDKDEKGRKDDKSGKFIIT